MNRLLSACVMWLICASTLVAADPADTQHNHLGLNVWFQADWDGANAFVDLMKHCRQWQAPNNGAPIPLDAQQWPLADCSTVLAAGGITDLSGAYALSFTGQAEVSLMWFGGSVSGATYDPTTNRTTATVTLDNSGTVGGLNFLNTRRTAASALHSGITDAHLYRPGYPTDGSQTFTTHFLTVMRKAMVIRTMDWGRTNKNPLQTWAQRTTPGSGSQCEHWAPSSPGMIDLNYGVSLEYMVQLANDTGADLWLNIPALADDEYVVKLSKLIRFGSDGTEPYTSPQSAARYPPLRSGLKLYVEYANEVWNSAGGFCCYQWVHDLCLDLPVGHPVRYDGLTPASDLYTLMWRYPAWRLGEISRLLRAQVGDAAMISRIRPVLMTQSGDGQMTLSTALQWADAWYTVARDGRAAIPLKQLFYGAGGSGYYGVNSWSGNLDAFFATGNYPEVQAGRNFAKDSTLVHNHGLRRVAYEGGMGLDNPAIASSAYRTFNADARMRDVVEKTHDLWSSKGGDLLVYYVVTGGQPWEFTPDITNPHSPKLQAFDAIRETRPRAPVTIGAGLPGTAYFPDLRSNEAGEAFARTGYDYASTIDGQAMVDGNDPGEWLAVATHSDGMQGRLVVRGHTYDDACVLGVYCEGVRVGTVTLLSSSGLSDSSSVDLTFQPGIQVLRFAVEHGSCALRSLTVTRLISATPVHITAQPEDRTVSVGQVATFSMSATGTPTPIFQWQKNDADISGATLASYTTPPTVSGDSGTTFRCVVSNSTGSVASETATLTVSDTTPPATPPAPSTTSNSSPTPTLSGSSQVAATVRIYRNAILVQTVTADGSGNWSWAVSPALAVGTYSFTVTASDTAGNTSGISSSTIVTVPDPTAGLAPSPNNGGGGGCGVGAGISVLVLFAATWMKSRTYNPLRRS